MQKTKRKKKKKKEKEEEEKRGENISISQKNDRSARDEQGPYLNSDRLGDSKKRRQNTDE
jgi:hypothetical protein